jgi:hypothetical protein
VPIDYTEFCEVRETVSEERSNGYLKAGWFLLFVTSWSDECDNGIKYVLGWKRANGEPKHPAEFNPSKRTP